jgi:translation initiation factor IF-2
LRARGARITNIVIIVVAADDGVKPQTVEAINHAKDSGVPIIVAITKIDKGLQKMDEIKGQLAEQGLVPEDRGGETMVIPLSAMTGQGIDDLLDAILLQTEMLELQYSP